MITWQIIKNLSNEDIILKTDQDGKAWWIPSDPNNSDYQEYLKQASESTPNLNE